MEGNTSSPDPAEAQNRFEMRKFFNQFAGAEP